MCQCAVGLKSTKGLTAMSVEVSEVMVLLQLVERKARRPLSL